MPRQKNAIPSYLLYKKSGQARVRINGRDHLLGHYGSEESRIKYGKLISQSVVGLSVDPFANRGTVPRNEAEDDSGLSVAELLLAFKRHADAYYTKNGQKTAEIDCLNSAMRPVRELFAITPARASRR